MKRIENSNAILKPGQPKQPRVMLFIEAKGKIPAKYGINIFELEKLEFIQQILIKKMSQRSKD